MSPLHDVAADSPSSATATNNVAQEIFATRDSALRITSAEVIQHLGKDDLVTLQVILRHGSQYGVWGTPEEWAPSQGGTATLQVDLRARLVSFLPPALRELHQYASEFAQGIDSEAALRKLNHAAILSQLVDGAVLTLTRYLLLLRMGPAGFAGRRKGASLDVSTVRSLAYDHLPRTFAACISKMLDSDLHLAERTSERVDEVPPSGYMAFVSSEFLDSLPKSAAAKVSRELERMFVLGTKGYWSDLPVLGEQLPQVTTVGGSEKLRKKEDVVDPHLPLPDDYVSTMGVRSLWLIQSLAPNLFPVLEKFRSIWLETEDPSLSPKQLAARRQGRVEAYLNTCEWRDIEGNVITTPPFKLYLWKEVREGDAAIADLEELNEGLNDGASPMQHFIWPPRNARDIFMLAHTVQLAHMFTAALAMAGRRSEVMSLKRSCVEYAANGHRYANGTTYKLVERFEGALRHWVLPDVVAEAIEQQVRLVSIVETIGTLKSEGPAQSPESNAAQLAIGHLWSQSGHGMGDRSKRLANLNGALIRYARVLGMETEPGGQNFRPHRLRKTVARLVALALVQAPKILMEVFGHKSIEMTLYYILTDKNLRAEVERVSRELRVMRATEVVEKMVADEDEAKTGPSTGGYGGPAALAMQRAIDVQKEGLHRLGAAWGTETAIELAELLTLRGKAWQYVRPGVICTKFPGTESGPCNKSKGTPEPARCQSHCRHRLEEAFLREDVDGAIRDSIKAYVDAGDSGEELVQALWAGQIRAHLVRFEDLRHKWMKDPVVQRVLSEKDAEGVTA